MVNEITILDRIIRNDVFCVVVDRDTSAFYVSDCLAAVLEIHCESDIEYPFNTPAVWNRKNKSCWLNDDPELIQAAAALAYMFNELELLETK